MLTRCNAFMSAFRNTQGSNGMWQKQVHVQTRLKQARHCTTYCTWHRVYCSKVSLCCVKKHAQHKGIDANLP